MTDKPKRMWHADGEGKCHAGCEQRFLFGPGGPRCAVMQLVFGHQNAPDGGACPFAVLADVLCAHQTGPEKPSDDQDLEHMMHLAWGCGYHYGRKLPNDDHSEDIDRMNADVHSLIIHERSEVRRVDSKPDGDRRCGTCAKWGARYAKEMNDDTTGQCEARQGQSGLPVLYAGAPGFMTTKDGPPWPNCRFWRRR